MKKLSNFLLAITVILIVIAQSARAQVTVNVTNETNTTPNLSSSYSSFAAALTDLNNVTAMSGPVTLTLQAGSETAPVKGFILGSASLNAVLSATNTITINTNGSVTINAGVGTSNGPTATPDGMLILNGADYVTIDGITFTDGNTTNATVAMEFGIALFKSAVGDGCNYNTIQNCTFNMQRLNNANGSGPLVEGSVGVGVYNSTYSAATTALTPTNGGTLPTNGTNSYNKFYSNNFNGGNYGIALNGYAATVGVGPSPDASTFLGDLGNDIGGSSSGQGNTILNYGGAASASNPAAGIRANNQWSINISYNTINNNNGSGVNHPSTLRGIFAQAGTSANANINYNNITVKGGATTSQVCPIENGIGSTAAGNTVNINNNSITGSYETATSGNFYGIYNTATAATINISENTVSNITSNATTGTFYGIYNSATVPTRNINGNEISNNTLAGTGNFFGIFAGAGAGVSNIYSNTINGNQKTGASGTMTLINATNTTAITCYDNNMYDNSFTSSSGSSSSSIYGISFSVTTTTTENIYNNSIYNLSVAGTNTATGSVLIGIYATGSSSGTKNIYGNTIKNLTCLSGATYGLYIERGANQIYKNNIFALTCSTTVATDARVNGILINGGNNVSAYIYNNYISDLMAPLCTSTDAVRGINLASNATSTTLGLYYNTIYLNAASSGANFGTTGVYHTYNVTGTTATLDMRDNIIVNNSTPNGSGLTVAFRRSAATDLNNYATGSNNNLFYAGTPSATNLIFLEGTTPYQTMTTFKTRVTPRETASISENPPFMDVVNKPYNLKINTATPTQIEGAGIPITSPFAINDDFEGDSRNATTPDIGADEFNGTSADLAPPDITYTPLLPTSSLSARTLVANISDAVSGVPRAGIGLPRLFWKIGVGGSWDSTTAVYLSGSDYQFTFGAGVSVSDVVYYYVVAQDSAATPNVTTLPLFGAGGFDYNPPRAATPPTTPYSYTITPSPLSGNYLIGVSGTHDYSTITEALTDLNLRGLSSSVNFLLIDNTYSTSETFPLFVNINNEYTTTSSNIFTLKPNTGVTATITGSSATGIFISYEDYVVLDGSNSGGSNRNLTLENTSLTEVNSFVVGLYNNGTEGSKNNTVKNCIIKAGSKENSTFGFTLNSNFGKYDNTTIHNNLFLNARTAINFVSYATSVTNGGIISNNVLGSDDNGETIGNKGIVTSYSNGLLISQNTIKNIKTDFNPKGIDVSTGTFNITISKNWIKGIVYASTGSKGGKGIDINTGSSSSNITIVNNMIADIAGDGSDDYQFFVDAIVGIRIVAPTSGVKLYNNSVNLSGNIGNVMSTKSAALLIPATSGFDIQNNILINTLIDTINSSARAYVVYCAGTNSVFSTIDYNNYYTTGSQGVLGYLSGNKTTLLAWQSATGQDASSKSLAVNFSSPTDLHLTGASIGDINLLGTYLASVTDDIDGDPRLSPPNGPYIGADEASAPLPIELSAFSISTKGNYVHLSWKTDTEVNSSKFEVERKLDNQNWVKVGEVAAAGNSNSPKSYRFSDKVLKSGKYNYRLKMVDADGSFKYSKEVLSEVGLPKEFAVSQNYPNPFNPTTRIDYQLPFDSKVTLELYGITGEKVATIINGELSAGYYTADVNASALNLASGVYIYRMIANSQNNQNFTQVKKLMLTK